MSINKKLNELYNSQIKGLKEISDKADVTAIDETYSKWDGPHLMYCWEDDYNNASPKILFIGKEPNTWVDCAWDQIEGPLEKYKEFALATNKPNITTFWRAVFEIIALINGNDKKVKNFLWTNVSKYCTWEGKGITNEDFYFINRKFNVLQDEIRITAPDIIIFFSGPDYDERIKAQFKANVEFNSRVLKNIPEKQLSLVKTGEENEIIPIHTYRTYHPSYLNRNKWYFLNSIALDCLGFNLEEIIDKLKSDFNKLTHVIVNDGEINIHFGMNKSTINLEVPEWKNYTIGFQFEENAFRCFFYGILNKNIKNDKLIDKIKSLPNSEEPNELWPYWKWYEQKNWSRKTFEEILTGEFINKIQRIIDDLLEKTKHFKM